MERKYGHKGYQESSREDRDRSQRPAQKPLSPEERAQQRSLRHAVAREASEVLRCPNCGRDVPASGAVATEIRQELQACVGPEMSVAVEVVDDLPLDASGKRPIVVPLPAEPEHV